MVATHALSQNLRLFQCCCIQLAATLQADRADIKQAKTKEEPEWQRSMRIDNCVPSLYSTKGLGDKRTKRQEGRKEMFYLTTHSTHFIYGYMASDIWLRTIQIAREETRCRHMGYSFRLTVRVLLYAPSHRRPLLHQSWSTGWNEK